MTYQVLSLKWRPRTFQDVVGQGHVTQTLVNAFRKKRVAQAYLFTGPRGVGKTTTARILASALNCLEGVTGTPCNRCGNCLEIADSRNLDVLEIDGASNRGIDEIRNLREMIRYAPMNSRYKIYIIDEVHMLTNPAFNALLKTLEEPPPHGKFIFATTDVHKVPATIISRCQRFDFNRITPLVIQARIREIVAAEGIDIDDQSLPVLARKADGSMRDALSLLDQVIAFSGEKITFQDTAQVIGLIPAETYFQFTTAVRDKDAAQTVKLLQTIQQSGIPITELVTGLNQHIRTLLYGSVEGGLDGSELGSDLQEQYQQEAARWDYRDLLRLADLLIALEQGIRRTSQPYMLLELTAMKMLEMDRSVSIDELLGRLCPQAAPDKAPATPRAAAKTVPKSIPPKQPVDRVPEPAGPAPVPSGTAPAKPVAGDSQPLPPPASSLSLEEIQTHWPVVVKSISKESVSLANILEQCELSDVHGNILEISLPRPDKFHQKRLENRLSDLESELQGLIDKPVKIRLNLSAPQEDQTPSEEPEPKTEPQDQKDALVGRIIELFDGEELR